jgi:hypothetical protein
MSPIHEIYAGDLSVFWQLPLAALTAINEQFCLSFPWGRWTPSTCGKACGSGLLGLPEH